MPRGILGFILMCAAATGLFSITYGLILADAEQRRYDQLHPCIRWESEEVATYPYMGLMGDKNLSGMAMIPVYVTVKSCAERR